MSGFVHIDGLSEIAGAYGAAACDAWGVIHNGRELLPGAADAMIRFRKEFGPLVILTNAPKPSSVIPQQLDRLGLPREAWDAVVTSGDATRAAIEKYSPAPAFRIGPSFDDPLFEGLDIEFVPLHDAGFVVCTGLNDGFTETPDDYHATLEDAAARDLPMVCANPDVQVNWGGKLMWCAGALGEIYAANGGRVIYGGKPHAPIYTLVKEKIAKAGGEGSVLAIGDGLDTDIRGANNAGLDALLITGRGGLLEGDRDDARLGAQLSSKGLQVRAIMEGLKW